MVRSASYYAAYQAKVDEVRAYLSENDNFSGPKRDLLETYMDEVISPNATYPKHRRSGLCSVWMDSPPDIR